MKLGERTKIPGDWLFNKPAYGVPRIYVPEQRVCWEPGVVSLNRVKVYQTGFEYDPIEGIRPWVNSSGNKDFVVIIEVWEDCGQDGHLEYFLDGWIPTTVPLIEEALASNEFGDYSRLTHLYRELEKDA